MKCAACGYEGEQYKGWKFIEVTTELCLEKNGWGAGDEYRLHREYCYLHACPECGTVRIGEM
jgi:hypothetical protein